jgi:hypothetical protein
MAVSWQEISQISEEPQFQESFLRHRNRSVYVPNADATAAAVMQKAVVPIMGSSHCSIRSDLPG